MSFTLRPRQIEDLNAVRHELRTHRSCVLVAPCGYGKGVLTTKIIDSARAKGKHVLFMVYGKDRVNDMHDRVTELGIEHGVLMGDHKRKRWHHVQIASISTLRRMAHLPKGDLIIIDEGHLGLSNSFRQVLGYYPDSKILALTATPVLGNGRALGVASGGIFESMVRGPSVSETIAEGHLVGSRVLAPPPPTELAALKKKPTGEFDDNQGAAICDNAKVIGDIVDHYKRYAIDRKAVVFGFNQKHAFDIAESFKAAGLNWCYIDADTPDGDIHTPGTRKFLFHQYDHGDLVGISSCQTISIGWDHSVAKCLIFASKTASLPLFHQRLGRGSRPHKGFDHFRVHDHTGNLYEFEKQEACFFESEIDWQLDGEPIKLKDSDSATRVGTCKRPIRVPESGVPIWFLGPLSKDSAWMLPCFATFPAGPAQCPYCKLPLEVQSRTVEVEDGELHEVQVVAKSEKMLAYEERMKKRYFELVHKIRTERRANGFPFSEKWPAVQFNLEFHRFPRKEWKAEAAALYGPPIEVESLQESLI